MIFGWHSMNFELTTLTTSLILFAGMVVCCEIGRRIASIRARRDPEGAWQGSAVIDGAIFGLLGLIVAFTFSSAASRFDGRRDLIVQEANAIGTAYLRLDLLPQSDQPAIRQAFREYLDTRIRLYDSLPDVALVQKHISRGLELQSVIWSQSRAAASETQSSTMLLLPALNSMFDIANTRALATAMHPPGIIYIMLFVLALVSAIIAGYGMAKSKTRRWLHLIAYSSIMAGVYFVIIDIEYPRRGAIQVGGLDMALRDLRKSMD